MVLVNRRRCSFKKPMRARFLCFVMLLAPAETLAQPVVRVLDRKEVVRLASEHAPMVVVAARRVAEARALRIGASIATTVNPELSGYVGPRWKTSTPGTDFFVGLAWPFDLSGAPSNRAHLADDRARVAEAEAEMVRRSAIGEALDLWARAGGAEERVRLETARLALDQEIRRAVEVKRSAGMIGDGDVALGRVLEAQGVARKALAESELKGLSELLRVRLGIAAGEPVALSGIAMRNELPPLEALVNRLPQQPAVVNALASVSAADTDASLQRRLRMPSPRVTAGGGVDPDSYVHIGLDLPLPVFQRNQTNVAVTAARSDTARAAYASTLALAEGNLRSAYAEYLGARNALSALEGAMPQVEDAEHLATRGYELGKSTLTDVLAVRREAAAARLAFIDAKVSLARAHVAVELLAGTLP